MMKNPEFEKCLEKGKIKPFSRGKMLASKEIALSSFDLERGLKSLKDGDYKWATIQSYYSMFHSGRAMIYFKNYREKSHYCLIIALEEIYKDNPRLKNLISNMWVAKRLREEADYYGNFSKESAQKLLAAAKSFLEEATKIMKKT